MGYYLAFPILWRALNVARKIVDGQLCLYAHATQRSCRMSLP